MSDMFWIALEMSNQNMGLIVWISSPVQSLTALKFDRVAKYGNIVEEFVEKRETIGKDQSIYAAR